MQKLQMEHSRLTEDVASSRSIADNKLEALNDQIESEKEKVAQALEKLKQSKAEHSAKKKASLLNVTEEKSRLLVSLKRVEQERDQLQQDLVYKSNQEKSAAFARNHLQTELVSKHHKSTTSPLHFMELGLGLGLGAWGLGLRPLHHIIP